MREVFADFMGLERLPDGRRRIRLSQHTIQREGLHQGDQVMLIEYGDLRAPAVITTETAADGSGTLRWYGDLIGDIEELDDARDDTSDGRGPYAQETTTTDRPSGVARSGA